VTTGTAATTVNTTTKNATTAVTTKVSALSLKGDELKRLTEKWKNYLSGV
jgi:hypothetical protein